MVQRRARSKGPPCLPSQVLSVLKKEEEETLETISLAEDIIQEEK